MNGSPKRRWLRRRNLVVGVAIAAVALACVAVLLGRAGTATRSGATAVPGATTAPGAPAMEPAKAPRVLNGSAAAPAAAQGVSADSGTSAAASGLSAAVPPLDPARFIVQTGDMTVYVPGGQVPAAASRLTAMVAGLGGYVLQSNIVSGVDGQKPWAAITVRVPARSFETAIQRVGLLGQVKVLETSAQDVTGQYVDLTARLAHYRAVEQRLLTFLAHAGSIGQALAIQQRIDQTQLTVERLAGQVKALSEQVNYATLAVTLTERPARIVPPPVPHQTFIAALAHSARLLGAAARALFVAFGAAIPFVVLVALLGWLGWLAAKRMGLLPLHRDSHGAELRS